MKTPHAVGAVRFNLLWIAMLVAIVTETQAALPAPSIRFIGAQPCSYGGLAYVCYEISVLNRQDYDNAMFELSPTSTGCRVQVHVYDLANPGNPFQKLCPDKRNDLMSLQIIIRKGKHQTGYVFVRIFDGGSATLSGPSNGVKLYERPQRPTGVRPGAKLPVSPKSQ